MIWLAALSLAVIMAVAGFFLSGFLRSGAASDMKPSVAVFYFDNNTGDESLDWLRTALTNMLVTDLSQSPQIEVLSTDRLYQLLDEMGQLDAPITSFEVVRDLAKKAGVGTVVLGDFVRAGDQFRLNTRVQDASNGRILATERVEGRGESSIFSMVDDLTRRIKGSLEVSQVPGDYADRGIQEVTTSSVQALRYYVEGNNLHIQSKEREAIPLLEKAVEVDPNFAMALAKLSVVHWNLGHLKEAYDFAHRSLENVDRLTARERYYIEGRYYSLKPETFDKAITAYEQAIKRYPHDDSARHNLAGVYSSMERYEEAIRHLEILRKRGNSFSGTYTNLAFAYASLGQYNRGREVLEEFVSRYPESAVGHRDLGTFLVRMGHNDEALVEFDRAENLSPGDLEVEMGRWTVFLITGRWNEAGKTTTRVRSSADPFWQFRGLLMEATNQLFHGRSMNAENSLEKAAGIFPDKGPFRCKALTYLASILRARQEFGKAMETAKQALSSGAGYPVESAALRELTLSQMASGQTAQAQQTLGKMRVGLNGYPPELSARRNDLMRGWISLLAGDYIRSARYSESALTELSGKEHDWEKATLWYNLGAAHWQAGNHQVAAAWFTRLHDNPLQGMSDPINYIRSLYYLAKYHHDSGDSDKARAYYRRMVELWGSGDLSPELVREARLRR